MSKLSNTRVSVVAEEEFVVFLIGMRLNKIWKVHKWLPVFSAMIRMLKELHTHPELGFMSHDMAVGRTLILVQYWRSFDALEDYAKSRTHAHLPAWAAFSKSVGSNGDVGIWHETYRVQPGDYECVYNNMPPFGLGKALGTVPATGPLAAARGRMQTVSK